MKAELKVRDSGRAWSYVDDFNSVEFIYDQFVFDKLKNNERVIKNLTGYDVTEENYNDILEALRTSYGEVNRVKDYVEIKSKDSLYYEGIENLVIMVPNLDSILILFCTIHIGATHYRHEGLHNFEEYYQKGLER